jgi:hypothetical protein
VSERSEALVQSVMAGYASQFGMVTKSAGGTGELERVEALVRSFCGGFVEAVQDHLDATMPILRAIYRGNEPVPHQLVEMDANQWSVTLSPDVPPSRMNGFVSKEAK